jgi:hypothetical protein
MKILIVDDERVPALDSIIGINIETLLEND